MHLALPFVARTPTRIRLAAFAAVIVMAGGAACSAATSFNESHSSAAVPTTAPAVARSAAQPQVLPAAPGGPPVSTGASNAAAPAPADSQAAAGTAGSLLDTSAQVLNRMVIRTAQLTVEVSDIEQALAQARDIASRSGGYVSASNTHVERVNNQDRMVADLTLQVRGDVADSAISELRALGNVTTENTGSQDVTEEYVDLDSNLRNLQASETAILKLMDKATQIQDVLSLQRELTNVRGQIERIQGRKTYLERRTDMATISLSLRLPTPAAESLRGAWDPLATALRGWQASLAVLRSAAEFVIIVLAFSWWLVPFIALGAYIWLRRRSTPRNLTPVEMV